MEQPERFVCVHGHFYQPPRENPWLESIEMQDSAAPYHDWNERITAECYDPNAASRIVDSEGRIRKIVNNYARISFNVGPTLMSWMEDRAPHVYQAIVQADRESRERFSGHGSALAQVYNHMILPLASPRDKWTQVAWGISDFRRRFGRDPEGMWLPETAADRASLDVLAQQGIRFTVLAPSQARRVRRRGSRSWKDVSGGRVDPTMPYEVTLPGGRRMAVFFYDGPVSRGIAFEKLLDDGNRFADRLMGLFNDERPWPQIVHVATDGETYGHHHRHGEMALSYALDRIESRGEARLTVYGEYLERHPPTHLVEIHEPSSWSCAHGVGRWARDCGCSTGMHAGWGQGWREPLRAALDWLRDSLAPAYEERAARLLRDPWGARDRYVDVVLDRSAETLREFLREQARRDLTEAESIEVRKLLELQRHAMLMYTSCGWFFDELSGIETVQVILYAARAIQLARETMGMDLEDRFLERLSAARSNIPEQGDGARVYRTFVRPAMLDLARVGAHYAISSLFQEHPEEIRLHGYTARREEAVTRAAGASRLLIGRARIASVITGEAETFGYGVLHFGDHNVQAGVRPAVPVDGHELFAAQATEAFDRADLPAAIRALDARFQGATSSLHSLFRDEQRKVVATILRSTLEEAEATLRGLYERHAPLLRFLAGLGYPAPGALRAAAECVTNAALRRALEEDEPDLARIESLLEAAGREQVALDGASLGYALERNLRRMIERFRADPHDLGLLEKLEEAAGLVGRLPFDVDTRWVQNLYYELVQQVQPEFHSRSDPQALSWLGHFRTLGERLWVRAA
ncbi:MAG TPA: DUF3536 domain-containing protein [Candidatus Polarisedimenticolia bacterium]|nr:DUF3536 domain-containing protein [Candidatus Polarisedimenticolia bacterium]